MEIKSKTELVTVIPICAICDLPARASLTGLKESNGYDSCFYCKLPGIHENNVHFWPHCKIPQGALREHSEIVENILLKQNGFHKDTVLSIIKDKVDIYNFIGIDYMHQHLEGNTFFNFL